jgi:hypothetical protein
VKSTEFLQPSNVVDLNVEIRPSSSFSITTPLDSSRSLAVTPVFGDSEVFDSTPTFDESDPLIVTFGLISSASAQTTELFIPSDAIERSLIQKYSSFLRSTSSFGISEDFSSTLKSP